MSKIVTDNFLRVCGDDLPNSTWAKMPQDALIVHGNDDVCPTCGSAMLMVERRHGNPEDECTVSHWTLHCPKCVPETPT